MGGDAVHLRIGGTAVKCYMIVLGTFTDLPRFMSDYQAQVGPLVVKFGGCYLLTGQNTQVLEGDWQNGGGAVISEWPDRAAALRFWHSPEYARVKPLRAGTGDFQVVLIDASS
jgi:uncharacterized protein (DUF1330 family)